MKIKNISCTQFAGVRDRNVSFTDGINVIYGKNESGKSTLVNLLSRALFQKTKLDRRSDKEFFELYFPGAKKGSSIVGDYADGKITIETENGTYTLSKEWGADARCTLSTPDGVIRDQNKIDQILKEALIYGEGVYSDMLFSSQRNTDMSLQTILDASKKTEAKQEITNAVSQVFAESDGVSVDAIEQAIAAKIEEIAGKHWDYDREAPVRKAGRWANGLGKILSDYYKWEDARQALKEISRLEYEADRAANSYAQKHADAKTAEDAYNRFHTFASRLAVQSERKKAVERIAAELAKTEKVLSEWPDLAEVLEKAKMLQAEKENRNIVDLWNAVQETGGALSDEDYAVAELPCPETAEISKVKKLQREILALENQLCGMNLQAAIAMLGGNEVHIQSLRTGEAVDISGGIASITEAVKITIPGVMEMQLSPADVDVAAVEEQIAEKRAAIAAVLAKYRVDTTDALEAYAQKIEFTKAKIENVNAKIAGLLGGISREQLEELYKQAGSADRANEEIDRDIFAVCGRTDIAVFITKTETVIDGYHAEYGSIRDLKVKAFDLEAERKKMEDAISGAEDIPAEYLRISDPDVHLKMLQNDLKLKQDVREAALTEKTTTANSLEIFKETHPDACEEAEETARREFEDTKALLNHWRHIEEVFQKQKDGIRDNPMQDIADNFTRYLGMISGDKLSSEFPEADKLNMNVYSDDRLMDYGKLSEGTKETVSLAFRLAVLDHLFPEGGGVIVFDDPFTDMDADRTAQSCKLIKECATRHQVIFLTCREDYLNALEGNRIRF